MSETATPPVAALEGSFAIYLTPEGGVMLVWRKKGDTENHPMLIPSFVINLAARQSGFTPEELLAKISNGETT